VKSFQKYLENYKPLPWTVISKHSTEWLVDNDELLVNFVRFRYIMRHIEKYFSFNKHASQLLDVGVYPGHMPQLFYEYYPKPENYSYFGVGLGFSDQFKEKMSEFGVELIECDLDPRLHLDNGRATSFPMTDGSIDYIIFTDVIEHLYDPIHTLQEINRVSKLDALMILTTDNLTRFNGLSALFRGRSCNVPLISGNFFYNGDWRPHFREYSREELIQLLQWAGFEVLEHHFYEAEFGKYRVVDGHLIKENRENSSLKGKLKRVIRDLIVNLIPHFRDNHIIVARKVESYEDMLIKAPKIVNNIDEWINQRQTFEKSR